MVHSIFSIQISKIHKTKFENSASFKKSSVNFNEITWIRIRIKIKWILSSDS